MIWVGAIVALAAEAPVAPGFKPRVEVTRSLVELGDVLDLRALPPSLKGRAAHLVITRFRPGQALVVATSTELAERARDQMPVLSTWLTAIPQTTISIRRVLPEVRGNHAIQRCLRATRAIRAGSYPTAGDFAPVPCVARTRARVAFGYDRRFRTARAERELAPGEIVISPPPSDLAAIRPSERLYLTAHVGPVVVTRAVTAIQPAPPGGALFVKAGDGSIFAAPVPVISR